MGIARQVPVRDATIATAESIDFIVQIRILHEVRYVTAIARVEKELRDSWLWCTLIFRFDWTTYICLFFYFGGKLPIKLQESLIFLRSLWLLPARPNSFFATLHRVLRLNR